MTMLVSVSRGINAIRSEDEAFLMGMGGRRITLDECLSMENVDSKDALDSIKRLIQAGYLCLVASVYTWGIEFEIQQTENGRLATLGGHIEAR